MSDTATLFIDRSSSTCGACNQGANPHELKHDTVFEYGPDSGRPGCGAEYQAVSSHYIGEDMERGVRAMRPDLPFVPLGQEAP